MSNINYDSLIRSHQELKDSLDVKVKIDWRQVLKVVVRDLIQKRNSCGEDSESREAFDKVLVCYLGDEDFEKYVIKGKKIRV